jgi:NAD-dependent SIR2 family protein deacetylase
MHIFPIDHGSTGQLACQTCHTKTDAEYTCYTCHDHQPDPIQASHLKVGISLVDLPNCASCHPAGKVEKK